MILEADVRYRIDRALEFKGWVLDSTRTDRNVFFESSMPTRFRRKLGSKRPDYTLFYDGNPIGVIEAKKPNSNLNTALEQGLEYADKLDAPLVFAMSGAFCKTRFLYNQKELYLNGNEVRDLLSVQEAVIYAQEKTNEVFTIPKPIIKSRNQLIQLFSDVNNLLRGEGLRAGIERFSEFANILFLKLLSEHNDSTYWRDVKNVPARYRKDFINSTIYPRLKQKYGGDVITPTKIEKPETLEQIVEKLDPLLLTAVDVDIKGSAFEHFLQKTTSTQNDLGEYFTPRHIVRAMVALVDPKLGETIYDPFCGTGGFLTEAFRYIMQTGKLSSEEMDKLQNDTLFGREITSTAVIAKMNMVLYGDGHSGVEKKDSLENPVDEEYDVVLTNIPFSQEATSESINRYYNGLANNNSDAACLLHCFRSLRPGGRMAVIVPEGVLSNRSLKQTRKFLSENSEICTVVKLPGGCFAPYTQSSTGIIFLRNKQRKTTSSFWFFDVRNDGFTLDAGRDPIPGESDLDILQFTFSGSCKIDIDHPPQISIPNCRLVDLPETYEFLIHDEWTGDFSERGTKTLSEVAFLKKGTSITEKKAIPGNIPVIAGGRSSPYSHNQSNYNGNVITVSASGAYSGFVWYHKQPIWASDCTAVWSKDEEVILTQYIYYCMKAKQEEIHEKQHGTGVPHVYSKDIQDFLIPIVSPEEQKEIIRTCEQKEQIIESLSEEIEREQESLKETIESIYSTD